MMQIGANLRKRLLEGEANELDKQDDRSSVAQLESNAALQAYIEAQVAQRVQDELAKRSPSPAPLEPKDKLGNIKKEYRETLSSDMTLRDADDLLMRLGRIEYALPFVLKPMNCVNSVVLFNSDG
jgi:hypothetical protein